MSLSITFNTDYNVCVEINNKIIYNGKISNLQMLNLTNCGITILPESIGKLTDLKYLYLSNNSIKVLPNSIGKLVKLQELYLPNNELYILPDSICDLIQMQKLNLSKNKLASLPENIGRLTNLNTLNIMSNNISILPNSIGNFPKIKYLYLLNNLLTELPQNTGNLIQLELLDVRFNSLINLPISIGKLSNLESFLVSDNKLKSLPSCLARLKKCYCFKCDGNEIVNIPANVRRWINGEYIINNLYLDNQNIHDSSIQESFRKSVENLLNDHHKKINYNEILQDNILTKNSKEQIIEFCNDNTIHTILKITFRDLFELVWQRIKKSEYNHELKLLLNEELMDSQCKCFTGRISRLVNLLNGYYDDINIGISENVQIGTIISKMLKEMKSKDDIKNELLKRNIDEIIINEWLEHVEQ